MILRLFTLCGKLFHTCMTLPIRLQRRKWRNKLRFHECTSDDLSYMCVFSSGGKRRVKIPLFKALCLNSSHCRPPCLFRKVYHRGPKVARRRSVLHLRRVNEKAGPHEANVNLSLNVCDDAQASAASPASSVKWDSLANSCGSEQTSHCCFQIEDSAVVLCYNRVGNLLVQR